MKSGDTPSNDPMGLDMNLPAEHHTPSSFKRKKPFNRKWWFIIGGAVLGVLLIGAVTYFLLAKDDTAAPAQQNTKTEPGKDAFLDEETPEPSADAATLQTFKSATLNIEVTHRKDWTAREVVEDKAVILTSPPITYDRKEGSTRSVFTLKIRQGVTTDQSATINNAAAVKDSEVIAYAAPTPAQRLYTNVSYAGKDDSFNFVMVTGSNAYKAGAPFTGLLLNGDTFLIAGGYGADKGDALEFDDIAVGDMEQSPAFGQAIDIIKSLKVF